MKTIEIKFSVNYLNLRFWFIYKYDANER